MRTRGWSVRELSRAIRLLRRDQAIYRSPEGVWHFTETGRGQAARVTRNHRLWEVYLLEHADTAPAHVDHGADFIEHVLGDALVAELEDALPRHGKVVPDSVHVIGSHGRRT